MTAKEKSRRRGWPRHAASFPPAQDAAVQGGGARRRDEGSRSRALSHSATRHPRTPGRVESGLGLGSSRATPETPSPEPAAGPPSVRALGEAAGNDRGLEAQHWSRG